MGPLDPVLLAGRDIDVISRPQLDQLLLLGLRIDEQQAGFTLHHQDPLMFILIVSFAGGRLMAVGENALDPQVIGADQILKEFGGEWRGDIVQQIAGVHGYLPSGGVKGYLQYRWVVYARRGRGAA